MKIWLISDTHFSHKNTLRYCGRPFFTIEQCDKTIIERINSLVDPKDTLIHLGDVAMHTRPMLRLIPQINCKNLILIIGNHELIYPYFLKTRGQKFIDRAMEDYKKAGFVEIHPSGLEISLPWAPWEKVRLSHFPTKNAEDRYHNDKHDAARPIDNGMLNICGHVHQNWLKRGNNVNVGVDVWDFKPILLEDAVHLYNTGLENMDTPYPIRTFVWTKYHTAVWYLKRFFNLFKSGQGQTKAPGR